MQHDVSPSRPRSALVADQIVDELMPEDLDWRDLARGYPLPTILLAALAGFFLGRHRGEMLLAAFGGFAVREASHTIARALDDAGIGSSGWSDDVGVSSQASEGSA